MKLIPLTKGMFSEVSDKDYPVLTKFRWRLKKDPKSNGNAYAFRTVMVKGKRINIYMHRFIMKPKKGLEIDHLDHNGLNNTRSNLKVVSHMENMANRLETKITKSTGHIGVVKSGRKYVAQIKIGSKHLHIGTFDTEKKALFARKYFERLVNIT